MSWGKALLGVLLVAFGLWFLLNQLHMLPAWGSMLRPGIIWPSLLALFGLWGLKGFRYGKVPGFALFCLTFGVLLVLRNSGAVSMLGQVGSWSLFFCWLVIFVGILLLLPKSRRGVRLRVHRKRDGSFVDAEFTADDWRELKHAKQRTSRWVGDVSLGRQPWTLKSTELWNAVGDIRINLATAHIEDGTHELTIGGWIGDVRVIVPESLPVLVNVNVSVGDVAVFDDSHAGAGRHVHYEDPGFATADRRVIIHVSLKIGDVKITRV